MSFLTTRSLFYYGFTVTRDNYNLDFNEGGPELTAQLRVGSYSATEYAQEMEDALNAVGALEYTVTFNRTTRKITIAASGTFALLSFTGSHLGSSVWVMAGFSILANKTGAASYLGDSAAGSEYRPQAVLKDYVDPEHFKVKEFAKVNVAASGDVQMVQFGTGKRFRGNIWQITDRTATDNSTWETQSSAIAKAIDFLDFLITKGKVEFMPDRDSPNTYYRAVIERTSESGQGTQYLLNEMDAKDFYQTGPLLFRVLPD